MKLIDKDTYSEIIKNAINKTITQKEAAIKLGISARQIRRIITKYNDVGEAAFVHGNISNKNAKKISNDLSNEIINVYLKDFADFSFTHFYEEQGIKYGVSFSTMNDIFTENDILSPYAQHKTYKLYNEKMKKAMREKTIQESQQKLYEQRQLEEKEKHIRRSNIKYLYGQEVQMDAAVWSWFGNVESSLHLAVDKATKKVLAGYFDMQETTKAYLTLLMNMILNFGIPALIRTDKRNSFSINNAKSSKTKLNITQFGRMCEDLEIELSCNSHPLFKPNIERENGTFKRRLKAELRYNNITTINEANNYLNEIFIPKINKKFSYDINLEKCVMRKNIYTEREINFIISIRDERTIDNASSLKYFNNYYLPVNDETGEIMSFNSGTKCTVVNTYDNKLYGIINNKTYSLLLIEQNDSKTKASKNGFKPSDDNPWKKFRIK